MRTGIIKLRKRYRIPSPARLETGFSMLEAVVVVGVLLALAVGGFFAYGPITENAKIAATKAQASQVYTAIMVAQADGDPSTDPTDIVANFNDSNDEYHAEIYPGSDPSAAAMTTGGYAPKSDNDFCLKISNKAKPSIFAQMGNCPADGSDVAASQPSTEPTTEPAPEPTPEPAPEPTPEPEVIPASLTWNSQKTVGSGDIYDIAASADGTKMFMTKNAESMYKSSDSGATWVSMGQAATIRRSVALSADGMKVLTGRDGAVFGYSTDFGVTFKDAKNSSGGNLPSNGGWHLAMSADATRMFAIGVNPSVFYSSSDGGATWAQGGTLHGQVTSKFVSSDSGAVLLAGSDGNQVLKSTDYGQSWSFIPGLPTGRWFALDISADGTRMAAADYNGSAWVSSTSGETWSRLDLPVTNELRSIAISSDGTKIAVGRSGTAGNIYTSTDSGLTWITHTSQGASNWRAVFSNSDGTKLFFGGTGGKLATGQY